MANLGVITALAARGEVIVADRLNHASLRRWRAALGRAAAALCACFRAVPRRDALAIGAGDARPLLATDGVFSMDGDIAPLAELARLARAHSTPGSWSTMRMASV